MDAALARLSEHPGTLLIGSDPAEWWEGKVPTPYGAAALHEGDRFFGTTVHYAARVASQALGGEVLVSSLVRELVAGAGVGFQESREAELKGLDDSHKLFAVDLD